MKALKALGQNFLIDKTIASEIVALGDLHKGDKVWEIGPGTGILTDEILSWNVQLRAFELDKRLQKYLSEHYQGRFVLESTDILQANWDSLIQQDGYPLKLIANIPYQITSPLLALLEKHSKFFSRIVLMVQKEVAQRLCAQSHSKHYSPLTIRLHLVYDIYSKIQVNKEKFNPVPKVDSTVILLLPRTDKPIIKYPESFNNIIDAAFAHRRKTLANNFIPVLGKEKTKELENLSQINFRQRGEELEEKDFILLSELVSSL
ncbi:MAG TPA: 16S rRNA (adenine(1518)-N(6)/adenine(1519)-N(6))-dimethyltransferase RsmA [Candidatus Cloacimonas sp.]|jgi:16S rRNA (adenine1518-N6/adenine1519-N6)-dimethyltransferase|nr:ribosomal RNA small subunit methyltransferase A [Candidatus Cloacimonas sp.]MDD2250442.1 16S rRNA (adenine(1518)-N(6)/adenine(1519)-N(6))-dimethyltransferase RsmA [Candidatus Cloacimonadota bacterium]MCK9157624.1 16S rRNA (adenine(1518)-N(6)/adenine(1519)-N(6))-dimethyltransferase RsmA [Candidatus Cloacimonas sp.]MCK9165070.1 16S rRNA (adenine(1518)-N(6)/adenine(1519)-N(6))-dimethyltransferase RsmA [Candidatus Cloacimonas sp.]MDD3734449.1 16S rRNA (adenine(1518)-N(6)/adenine(1519)-N(6))-dime